MKRKLVAGLLTLTSLTQNLAYADMLELPDPNAPDQSAPVATSTPSTPQRPQTEYQGSVIISKMSQKAANSVYRVDLKTSLFLSRLNLGVTKERVRLSSVTLVTDRGQRVSVYFRDMGLLRERTIQTASGFLNQGERVSTIEITAEAIGGEAEMLLEVVADREVPVLALRRLNTNNTATAANPRLPQTPKTPHTPTSTDIAESSVIRPGDTVIFGNTVGVVDTIFSNGKANFQQAGGYERIVNLSELAKSLRCDITHRICAGDKVILSQNNSIGFATKVFANGKAVLERNGYYHHVVNTKDLSKSVKCLGILCTNDEVIYGSTPGRVATLFENGKAHLVRNGYYDVAVNISDLGKAINCDKESGICTGNGVYFNRTKGVVKQIYSNGRALVARDGYYDTMANTRDLSKRVAFLGEISTGDLVNYLSTVGTVKALYANGAVLLGRDGYYDTFVLAQDLGKSLHCFKGICAGDIVVYSNSKGQVTHVFNNGKALLVRNGYYDAIVKIEDLGKALP